MSTKHEAQYKKLIAEFDLKEIELKNIEQRWASCDLQFFLWRE